MNLLVPALYVAMGIILYAMIQHFVVGLAPPFKRAHKIFSALCLFMIVFSLAHIQVLQSTSVHSFLLWTRIEIAVVLPFMALLIWFIAFYTNMVNLPFLFSLSSLLGLLWIMNAIQPLSLQYEVFTHIYTMHLPWGEQITRGVGQHGNLFYLASGAVLITLSYACYLTFTSYQRHKQQYDLFMLIGISGVILNAFEGILSRLGIIHVFEAGPFGFLAMVIVMGIILLRVSGQNLRKSERHFRLLFDHSPISMISIDPKSVTVSDANQNALDMTGFNFDELVGKPVIDIHHKEGRDKFHRLLTQMLSQSIDRAHYEGQFYRKDGGVITIDTYISALRDEKGIVEQFIASGIDISEKMQSELALRESEYRFRVLFEQAPIGISISQDGITIDVNQALLEMYGYDSANEIRGTDLLDRIAPSCRNDMQERVKKRIQNMYTEPNYETTGLRKNGKEFPLFITAKRIMMQDGPISIAYLIDFTERKANEEKIRQLAFYDQLTHLPNRRLLFDRLRHSLLTTAKTGQHGALLLIDLDNFKTINDTLGHTAGDALLQQIAARMTANISASDTIGRLGGDEFVIVLENLGSQVSAAISQTESAGERIIEIMKRPFSLFGREYRHSCSIGATLFNGNTLTVEELLKQADIAMYEAKKDPHNALRFFDKNMQEIVFTRAKVEGELYKAIENGEFKLHYQIQINEHREIVGAEALIRWEHPHRGIVYPAEFIPLAEETGQIVSIGRWVIESACAQLRVWALEQSTHHWVLSINVCSIQFNQPDFTEIIHANIERHKINPERLKLELTESILLDDIEFTIARMQELKQIGIQLSLDDFGTGYSSLKYLQQLPLDQLKIDQSFIRDIAINSSARAIVETIVAMAGILGLTVIAEGVETEKQRAILYHIGCILYQGYLFGRPVPVLQ